MSSKKILVFSSLVLILGGVAFLAHTPKVESTVDQSVTTSQKIVTMEFCQYFGHILGGKFEG